MPKKCRVCKKSAKEWPIPPRSSMAKVCSVPCAQIEAANERERAFDRETKRRKEAIKSLEKLCVELQEIVNKYIRLRDIAAGWKCISCRVREITDAGHFYHAGTKYRTSRLRFDLRNINGQCDHCNRFKGGGNAIEYQEGFIQRYGWEEFEALRAAKLAADHGTEKPLTKDEVRAMKKEFRAKNREIEKGVLAS